MSTSRFVRFQNQHFAQIFETSAREACRALRVAQRCSDGPAGIRAAIRRPKHHKNFTRDEYADLVVAPDVRNQRNLYSGSY